MTDRDDLLALVRELAIVHGKVTLSSGREADYYVDLRRITLAGRAAPLVGRVMLELTADLDFDAVGGLTMGADPVAAAMLHAAAARGAVVHLPRLGLGQIDEFLQRARFDGGRHHNGHRAGAQQHHRCEALDRVERQLGANGRHRGM